MLELYFQSAVRLRQMRRGPLASHLDAMAENFRKRGYSVTFARCSLSLAGKFNGYLRAEGISDVSRIDDACVNRFIKDELEYEGRYFSGPYAMRHVLAYLREQGIIAKPEAKDPEMRFFALLEGYRKYLEEVRGSQPSTCKERLHGARQFLLWFERQPNGKKIENLTGKDVLRFFMEVTEDSKGRPRPYCLASKVRIFFRYLHFKDLVGEEIVKSVPSIRMYKHASIPRHLSWDQVRKLIDSVDDATPSGMRDKAVLLLIAQVGLRAGEVRDIRLADIAWRKSELHLPRTKNMRARTVPLPKEAGEALANYVLYGRPTFDSPFVFLRHYAPLRPLSSSAGISYIVSKNLRLAGIDAPSYGPHLLRHSLATRMINAGVSVKEIADVLGHANIDSTAIYAKVDMTHLAQIALPFPTGGAR